MKIKRVLAVMMAFVFLAGSGPAAYACGAHAKTGDGSSMQQEGSNSGMCAGCQQMGPAQMKEHMKESDSGGMGHDMQSGDHMKSGRMPGREDRQMPPAESR